MMSDQFTAKWVLRRPGPAKNPPNPNFPYGIALDFTDGRTPACLAKLQYPAPGVGTWIVTCEVCGFTAAVTAAGRADDPTQALVPCKKGALR